MARAVLWVALVVVGVGFAASALVVAESLRPKPGADMVLMGLPLIALPTMVAALVTVYVVRTNWHRLSRWERVAGYAAGVPVVLICAALAVLG
jgi:uncharacterized transporter YbjL